MNRLSRYLRAPVQHQFADLADGYGLLAIVGSNYRERIPGPRYAGAVINHMNRLALLVLGKQTDRSPIAVSCQTLFLWQAYWSERTAKTKPLILGNRGAL